MIVPFFVELRFYIKKKQTKKQTNSWKYFLEVGDEDRLHHK